MALLARHLRVTPTKTPFFDSGMRDLIFSLTGREAIVADAQTRDSILSSTFLNDSRFGSAVDARGPATYLSESRAASRSNRLAGGALPLVVDVNSAMKKIPSGIERVFVACNGSELEIVEELRSSHSDVEFLSLKNDAHPLLRIPQGFDMPLESFLRTPPTFSISDLVIAAVPRSGSYLLAEYLNAQGLGLAEEHLKEDVARAAKLPISDFSFSHWLGSLRRGGHVNGRFATKFMSHYWWRLHHNLAENGQDELARFLQSSVVVVINRQDRVLQAVSSYISMKTQVYRLRSTRDAVTYNVDELEYDSQAVTERYHWTQEQYRRLLLLLTEYQVTPLVVDYEDLVSEPIPLIREVSRALGVEAGPVETPARNRQMRTEVSSAFAERFREENPNLVSAPLSQFGTELGSYS